MNTDTLINLILSIFIFIVKKIVVWTASIYGGSVLSYSI
jgi:hypothetical protein